jgi:hypothetical protein
MQKIFEDIWGGNIRQPSNTLVDTLPKLKSTTSVTPITSTYEWDMPENVWQSWFPAVTYANWGGWGGEPFDLPQMKQVWWRSPEWGGGIVWHPYWGWQDKNVIKALYEQAQGPVTWQQFISWPLERHLEPDWRIYYPNYPVEGGGGSMGGGGNMANQIFEPVNWPYTYAQFSFPQYSVPQQMNVQYPGLWQGAEQTLGAFMGGGGLPVNIQPVLSSLWNVTQRDLANKLAQEREAAGLKGTLYSSPFIAAQTRNILDALSQWGLAGAQLQAQAEEAARQRMLAATGQAAGLGGQMVQYPMQLAQMAYSMGAGLQQPYQQAMQMAYEDFLRLQQPSAWQQAVLGTATQQYPIYPAYKSSFSDFLPQLLSSIIASLPLFFL